MCYFFDNITLDSLTFDIFTFLICIFTFLYLIFIVFIHIVLNHILPDTWMLKLIVIWLLPSYHLTILYLTFSNSTLSSCLIPFSQQEAQRLMLHTLWSFSGEIIKWRKKQRSELVMHLNCRWFMQATALFCKFAQNFI